MRKILGWFIGLLAGLAVVAFGLQVVASESGEVVVLHARADDGDASTRLWVVDHDGDAWLRSGGGDSSGWYARLLVEPRIQLEREGQTHTYTAEPMPAQRDEINRLMAEKYGWRDRLIGLLIGSREAAIPVRLRPTD